MHPAWARFMGNFASNLYVGPSQGKLCQTIFSDQHIIGMEYIDQDLVNRNLDKMGMPLGDQDHVGDVTVEDDDMVDLPVGNASPEGVDGQEELADQGGDDQSQTVEYDAVIPSTRYNLRPRSILKLKVVKTPKPARSVRFNDLINQAYFKPSSSRPFKHKMGKLDGVKSRPGRRLKMLKLMLIRSGVLSESDREMTMLC